MSLVDFSNMLALFLIAFDNFAAAFLELSKTFTPQVLFSNF